MGHFGGAGMSCLKTISEEHTHAPASAQSLPCSSAAHTHQTSSINAGFVSIETLHLL